jgi:hypothetical protein
VKYSGCWDDGGFLDEWKIGRDGRDEKGNEAVEVELLKVKVKAEKEKEKVKAEWRNSWRGPRKDRVSEK